MKRNLKSLLLIVLFFSIFGCSKNEVKFDSKKEVTELIWPSKPEKPRIAFAGSFSNAEDLGIEKGFFKWVVEVFAGEEQQRLVTPMGIIGTTDNLIYVADPGVQGVHRFDMPNNDYTLIRLPNDQLMQQPVSLAIGRNGSVFITDSTAGKIYKLKKGEDEARVFHTDESVSQPTGISVDQDTGWVYVVDTINHQVKVFEESGEYLMSFGGRGGGQGKFNFPTMIWRDKKDQLLISDSMNFRVQTFTVQGQFVKSFGKIGSGGGQHSRPKGIASDNNGNIYVVDSMFAVIQMFSPEGEFLMHFGQAGNKKGEFWLPTNVFIKENEAIYVADTFNKRIQVFYYIGGKSL
ncbi:MAG: 6-bladed beta-propeller [Gammaproteobacteria bacterium]